MKKKPKKDLSPRTVKTRAQQSAFLQTYTLTANIREAALAAGISRMTHYRWLKRDPTYRKRVDEAANNAFDLLEKEALRRAMVGINEPNYFQGKVVGYTKRYSDNLTMFLLKAARPEKFREVIHHKQEVVDLTKLDTQEVLAFRALVEKAQRTKEEG